jgi:hypothetical protein
MSATITITQLATRPTPPRAATSGQCGYTDDALREWCA